MCFCIFRWIYAYFSFQAGDLEWSLIFEGVRGGLDGDIAIDDIKITPGECPYMETQCNFEASCHFNQVCESHF